MKVNLGIWNNVFAIPATVVDNHITKCGSVQLKVLLYLLRFAGRDVSIDEMSEKLSVSVADVSDSLNYWISENIITNNGTVLDVEEDINSCEIIEVNSTDIVEVKEIGLESDALSRLKELSDIEAPKINNQYKSSAISPKFTSKEAIDKIKSDPNLKFLMDELPRILKRTLTNMDIIVFVSLIDWTGISIDLFMMIVDYSVSINKKSPQMIEREAYRWINNGIDTHEKAERFIAQRMKLHRLEESVMAAMHKEFLTDRERSFVNKWMTEYKYDIDIIRLAYERAIMRKGEKDLSYVNGILSSWFKKGIKKPEQVDDENGQTQKKQGDYIKSKSKGLFQSEKVMSFSVDDLEAKINT